MSALAEVYALGSGGIPLSTPTIAETFYPLDTPLDKVILIHAFAGGTVEQNNQRVPNFPAKLYEHFEDVARLLKLAVEGRYRVYQIGAPGEPVIRGVESLVGQTSIHQCAYLVNRSALLIGNDSQWAHIRGAAGKPLVALYGPTTPREHGPYWQVPSITRLLESHRRGARPSFASHEGPKTINWIAPETVANAALELLKIDPIKEQTVYIGDQYHQPTLHLVPDVVVNPQLQLSAPLVIRADLCKDEKTIAANLQLRRCLIITDVELDLGLLAQARQNIVSMRIEIDKLDPQWLKRVRRLGIPIGLFSTEPDFTRLQQKRLDFYDICAPAGFDQYTPPSREDFVREAALYLNKTLDSSFNPAKLLFRTNSFVLSGDKVYLSEGHWRAGRPTPSTEQNTDTVIDEPVFWSEFNSRLYYTST